MKRYRNDNQKTSRRIASFLTAAVMIANMMPIHETSGLLGYLQSYVLQGQKEAELTVQAIDLSKNPEDFSVGTQHFADTNVQDFITYCYYYSINEGGFAQAHQRDTIELDNIHSLGSDFVGLGHEEYAFGGKIELSGSTSFALSAPVALFSYVYDSVALSPSASTENMIMKITKSSKADSALFADHVKHDLERPKATWMVEAVSENSIAYGGVIGEMMDGAKLDLEFTNNSSAPISASGDVGAICGAMKESTNLSVTYTENNTSAVVIESTNGNAGGIVGSMAAGATITMKNVPAGSKVVTAANYAGGLVGDMVSSAKIDQTALNSDKLTASGSVTGGVAAGGLFGHYENSETVPFDLNDYTIDNTVFGQYCGGVFGVLENKQSVTETEPEEGESEEAIVNETPSEFTIKNTGDIMPTFCNRAKITVNDEDPTSVDIYDMSYFGGLIGKYTTDDLKNSLIFDNIKITANAVGSFDGFSGVIGLVDSAAYVKSDDVTVHASGTDKAYFGGFIGETASANGVFVDLGDFTLTTGTETFGGGGVVGKFQNGVLRLSGITDMSSTKAASGGQLVGENDNVLVYALGNGTNGVSAERDSETGNITTSASGWTFKRSNGSLVDDLGTWGEVVRISDIESILTVDSSNHTVTVPAAVTAISSPTDFVKTALNIQLNQGSNYDCLLFTEGDVNKRENLLKNTSLTIGTVSLANTGITGFMRDGGSNVGVFTGTLTGSGTVTLAIGEKYGQDSTGTNVFSSSTAEGIGQIYAHPYNGLFAFIGNGTTGTGTVNSLTIDGSINVRNTINGMNIGGIAAVSQGNTSLSGITASQTVNYGEPDSVSVSDETGSNGKNIGGLIGLAYNSADNGTIAITGTNTISTTFNISDYYNSWNTLGAFIGKVASPKFTINIAQGASDKLTVSHAMTDINKSDTNDGYTAGSNADGGGLIGYITSGTYSNRTVNIKNLDFNNCTIINKASSNGGGFLGYAWLDTSTTIDGLTVTNGTITNSSPNVGVMCYIATGKWVVNSLAVTKMSLSGGAETSLGMLVNTAYNDAKGLYLDVLNSGYTLTKKTAATGITLPSTLGVYDELAAYSANDVIKGTYKEGNTTYGAGVISINMNADRSGTKTKLTDKVTSGAVTTENGTGTYQNKLDSTSSSALANREKYPNKNARYYYNLDDMSSENAAENVVLWSVNKYAASNISSLFSSTESPFVFENETNVDLSGYSFYPVYSTSGITIENANLTFDYAGIRDAAETVFVSPVVTDGFVRDPGNNGTDNTETARNQHYLMHSGLFINQAEDSTLTLNTVKLSGNFLEVGNYKGVLVSGTSHGSLSVNGLTLDGIKPNAATGYLLVNHIKREYTTSRAIELLINDVITTDKYTITDANNNKTTAQIAKSLFGTVDGPKIDITLSAMQIDARKANESDAQLTADARAKLNTAYKTVNSIFTTSTFFESINTNASAALIYNYSYDEDWKSDGSGPRKVTYGKEVSESVQWAGKEKRYSKNGVNSTQYTDPTKNDNVTSPGYSFASGWLPYVADCSQEKDGNGYYKRELKVNVAADLASEGCGTYNDPYQIKSNSDLVKFAKVMYSGDTGVTLILPKSKSSYDDLSKVTSGNRWCNDNHATYTWNQSSTAFTSTENGAESWNLDEVRLYLENAYYLVKNNISLDGGDNGFQGLGGDSSGIDNTGKYAFRGVIVGEKNTDDTPKWTITNNSNNPLVNISNGCVIKDINIVQKADISLTQKENAYNKAYFRYKDYTQESGDDEGCAYYGGFIGEIMGGDNIIDNSYVSYKYQEAVTTGEGDDAVTTMENRNATVTLQGSNGTIVPVGGYVGVVVFGGLIFKNMDARKTTVESTGLNVVYSNGNTHTTNGINLADSTDSTNQESWAAIYVNPIVGRVINGYAVNETGGNALNADGNSVQQFSVTEDGHYHDAGRTSGRSGYQHTLQNGAKHYSIADIDPSLGKLDVTPPASTTADGTINVPSAQAMFILSLITQSTSGTAQTADGEYQNSLSYGINGDNVYGMSHNADYTNVGSASAVTDTDYVSASEDTAANTAVPYIIRKYTVHTEDREVTNTWTEIEQRPKYIIVTTVTKSKGNKYTGNGTDLDGVEVYIQVGSYYLGDSLKLDEGHVDSAADKADGPTIKRVNDSQAAIYCFELAENNQYYLYTTDTDGNKRYLYCNNKGFGEWKGDWTTGLGFTENKNDAALFNVEKWAKI